MDFQLTDTQKQIRETAWRMASSFPITYWRQKDKDEEYPWEFVKLFADGGWMGVMIPERYGGMGLGVTEAALILHEVAASGAGMSGASAIHFCVFPPSPIIRHGNEQMKATYLPRLAAGQMLVAFGITEPNAGSDTSRIETRAEQRNGAWVINGQKVWTTNAQNAEKILLLTRTSARDEKSPLEGMTLFFTDFDRKYCTIRKIDKLGRAAIDSNEVFIENLPATDGDIVGEVGKGFYHLLSGLNPERIVLAAEAIGIGRCALRIASEYAANRQVFGRLIGQNQAIAHPLAKVWAALESAELMVLKAAWLYDHGNSCAKEANAAKYLAAEAAFQACDAAVQTLGGFGYAKEFDVERLWREVRLYKIAPISQEMVLNYLSHKALNLPKSY
ncbi:acyl-CoA dehydrogenase family protein [Alicyclobacillus dauci]|uniref:Acyl-CoA/acyl-ACP dehydrogenase n=1 Tax=Alicyclobacillus dauci TaxID=1475485 RepID=A0ABY6Z1I1_9BACL|nr:acyl-CoA dehydrogenase family protein [Alicyclobacillus dauci]WAH36216.1 acyl-CoA/acyl-ACP dehydrogenase [Alicyclobacillus dauci]